MLAKLCLAPSHSRANLFEEELKIYFKSEDTSPSKNELQLQQLFNSKNDYSNLDEKNWARLVLLNDQSSVNTTDHFNATYESIEKFARDKKIDFKSRVNAYLFLRSQNKSTPELARVIFPSILDGDDPDAWAALLSDPSCPENVLATFRLNNIRGIALQVFNVLGNLEEESMKQVLKHFAKLQDPDITINLISLSLSPEFSLEVMSNVFQLCSKPDSDDDFFTLFFFEKALAENQEKLNSLMEKACNALKEAIEYYPESDKTQELISLFIKPKLQKAFGEEEAEEIIARFTQPTTESKSRCVSFANTSRPASLQSRYSQRPPSSIYNGSQADDRYEAAMNASRHTSTQSILSIQSNGTSIIDLSERTNRASFDRRSSARYSGRLMSIRDEKYSILAQRISTLEEIIEGQAADIESLQKQNSLLNRTLESLERNISEKINAAVRHQEANRMAPSNRKKGFWN